MGFANDRCHVMLAMGYKWNISQHNCVMITLDLFESSLQISSSPLIEQHYGHVRTRDQREELTKQQTRLS